MVYCVFIQHKYLHLNVYEMICSIVIDVFSIFLFLLSLPHVKL